MRTVQNWFTHLLTRHNCVSLEPKLSVLDFILQLWRKLKTDCRGKEWMWSHALITVLKTCSFLHDVKLHSLL